MRGERRRTHLLAETAHRLAFGPCSGAPDIPKAPGVEHPDCAAGNIRRELLELGIRARPYDVDKRQRGQRCQRRAAAVPPLWEMHDEFPSGPVGVAHGPPERARLSMSQHRRQQHIQRLPEMDVEKRDQPVDIGQPLHMRMRRRLVRHPAQILRQSCRILSRSPHRPQLELVRRAQHICRRDQQVVHVGRPFTPLAAPLEIAHWPRRLVHLWTRKRTSAALALEPQPRWQLVSAEQALEAVFRPLVGARPPVCRLVHGERW